MMITHSSEQMLEKRTNMRGGNGVVELRALIPELPAAVRLFSRIELAPGCSIGYHVHENETELFFFASGSGRASDDGTWINIAAGDAMATSHGHGHSVENPGSEPLVILATIIKD